MRTIGAAAVIVIAAVAVGVDRVDAHDPFPSKYTYNDDVYSILAARCGRCHVDGGAAPMPLTSYAKVRPWSEAIAEQLMSARMPPRHIDRSGPPIVGPGPLSPRELDVILTWAAGGTPEGKPSSSPPLRSVDDAWELGPPDATFPMSAEHTLPASRQDETREFDVPASFTGTRWIRAADLRPGTRSMVRDARIVGADGTVLALWVAGEQVIAAPPGTAFRVAGTALRLRVHYRKSWEDGPVARSDRSTIALYFTPPPRRGKDIRTVSGERVTEAVRVLAVRPTVHRPAASVDVTAVSPGGRRVTLLRLRTAEPGWPRRYWLAAPTDLEAGSRIVITAVPAPGDPDPAQPARLVDVALDVVTP